MTKKKYALVTGGAKRIGAELCKVLISKDYNLIIHYNHSEVEAESLKNALKQINSSVQILTYKADLTNDEELKNLIFFIEETFEGLNVLINNASFFDKDINCSAEPDKDVEYSAILETINYYQDIHVKVPMFLFKWMMRQNPTGEKIVINMLDTLRSDEFEEIQNYGRYFSYSFSKHCQYLLHRYMEKAIEEEKINCRIFGLLINLALSNELDAEYFKKKNVSEEQMKFKVEKICSDLGNILDDSTIKSQLFEI